MFSTINMLTIESSKYFMGDRFSDMVQCFLQDVDDYLHEMSRGLIDEDIQRIRQSVRSIKSSSYYFGADDIYDTLRSIDIVTSRMAEQDSEDFKRLKNLYANLFRSAALAKRELTQIAGL